MMWTNCKRLNEQHISVQSFKEVWGTKMFQGVAFMDWDIRSIYFYNNHKALTEKNFCKTGVNSGEHHVPSELSF